MDILSGSGWKMPEEDRLYELSELFKAEGDLELVGAAADGGEALQMAAELVERFGLLNGVDQAPVGSAEVVAVVAVTDARQAPRPLCRPPHRREAPFLLRTRLLLLRAGRLGASPGRRSGIHCERGERHCENNQDFLHLGFSLLSVYVLKTVQSTFNEVAEAMKKA